MNPFERYAAQAQALAADVTIVVKEQVGEAVSSVEAVVHPHSAPAVSPQPEAVAPAVDFDTPAAGAPADDGPPADAHASVSLIADRIEAKADDAVHVAADVASTVVPAVEHQVEEILPRVAAAATAGAKTSLVPAAVPTVVAAPIGLGAIVAIGILAFVAYRAGEKEADATAQARTFQAQAAAAKAVMVDDASAIHEAVAHKAAVQRQADAVVAAAKAEASKAKAEQASAIASANEVISTTQNDAGEAVAAAQAETRSANARNAALNSKVKELSHEAAHAPRTVCLSPDVADRLRDLRGGS